MTSTSQSSIARHCGCTHEEHHYAQPGIQDEKPESFRCREHRTLNEVAAMLESFTYIEQINILNLLRPNSKPMTE